MLCPGGRGDDGDDIFFFVIVDGVGEEIFMPYEVNATDVTYSFPIALLAPR